LSNNTLCLSLTIPVVLNQHFITWFECKAFNFDQKFPARRHVFFRNVSWELVMSLRCRRLPIWRLLRIFSVTPNQSSTREKKTAVIQVKTKIQVAVTRKFSDVYWTWSGANVWTAPQQHWATPENVCVVKRLLRHQH